MESNSPPSLELAMDSVASPSLPPSESAYDADSKSKVAHGGIPPNFGTRPHHGCRANSMPFSRRVQAEFSYLGKSQLVKFPLVSL